MGKVKSVIGIGGVGILIISVGVALWRGGDRAGGAGAMRSGRTTESAAPERQLHLPRLKPFESESGSVLGGRAAGLDPSPRSEHAREKDDRERGVRALKHFFVMSPEFHEESLEGVVEWLRDQAEEFGDEDAPALSDVTIAGIPRGRVTFAYPNEASPWAVLNLAAAQTGMELEVVEDGGIVLRALPLDDHAGPATETEIVLPHWTIEALVSRIGSEAPAGGVSKANSEKVAADFLRAFGIELPDGASASIDQLRFLLRAGPRETAIAEAIAPLLDSGSQVFITTKVVEVDSAVLGGPRVMNDAETVEILKRFSGTAGADLFTAPSLVTRPKGEARVSIPEATTPLFEMNVVPTVTGGYGLRLAGDLGYSPRAGLIGSSAPSETEFDIALMDGETAIFPVHDAPGKRAVVMITARIIDESGQPARVIEPSR